MTSANTYEIAVQSKIEMSNLKKGELYGIFSNSYSSFRTQSRNGSSSGLTQIGLGNYIHYSSSSSDLVFYGTDIGIDDYGRVCIIKYEPENQDMMIDTAVDDYVFIDDEGYRVYQEYYRINLQASEYKNLDRSRIAVLSYATGSGKENSISIINETTGKVIHTGIFDFSDRTTLSLLNQRYVKEGNSTQYLNVINPKCIQPGEEITLSTPFIYEVEKTNKELVLEIALKYDYFDYQLQWGNTHGRVAEGENAGVRQPYIFPMNYNPDNNKVLLYIGPVKKTMLFNISAEASIGNHGRLDDAGSMILREITPEEKELLNVVNVSEHMNEAVTISLPAGQMITPVIFTADNPEDQGEFYVESSHNARVMYTNGYGYAPTDINNWQTSADLFNYDNQRLEYLFVTRGKDTNKKENYDKDEEVVLLLSKNRDSMLMKPQNIQEGKNNTLKTPSVYKVEATDKELVLEIALKYDYSDYQLQWGNTHGRVAEGDNAGVRQPYIFPMNYDSDNNKVLLYIGTVKETMLFNISAETSIGNHGRLDDAGSMILREITSEEKKLLNVINVSEHMNEAVTISLPAGQMITPVIFTADNPEDQGEFDTDKYSYARVMYTNGYGYAPTDIDNSQTSADLFNYDDQRLEYLFVTRGLKPEEKENYAKEEKAVLTFSHTGEFVD